MRKLHFWRARDVATRGLGADAPKFVLCFLPENRKNIILSLPGSD